MEATMKTNRNSDSFKGMIEIDPATEANLIEALKLEGIPEPIFKTVSRAEDGETVRIMIVSNANADLAFVTAIKVECAPADLTIAFKQGAVTISSVIYGMVHVDYDVSTGYAISIGYKRQIANADAETAILLLYSVFTVDL